MDWAPENLIIPSKESPKLAGYFDWQYSPHLREPCHWFNDPFVRRITIMAGLQRGKTLFMMLCLCWVIANDPGPTMLVMTDENTLRRRMKRIRPLFGANEYLLKKLDGRTENLFLGEPTDLGDMMLVLAWAGSAAMMSDYPIKYEFLDELVLWKQMLQDLDLDPMGLLRGRQNTFAGESKTVTVSSSGNVGDLLDTEFEDGDRCEYWVPCPRCTWWQIPRWYDKDQPGCHMVIDRDKSGDWLRLRDYEEGKHARYVCPSCLHPWSDYARVEALQEGRWLPAGVTMDEHGTPSAEIAATAYKSARVRAVMIHPRIGSVGKMAADWVRGQIKKKSGNVSGLKYFLNNHEAQSWREEQAETDEERLRTHIGAYRSDAIREGRKPMPWGVQVLVMAIDVHDTWFRVVVDGYGHLFESWQIEVLTIDTGDTKEVDSFDALVPMLAKYWPVADGSWMPLSGVAIDSGYRPEPVKTFCRANRHLVYNCNLWPTRGSSRRMNRQYQKSIVDDTLTVYELNPLMLKDQLHRHLFEAQQPGGGYKHLPADITGEIVGELCSEHKVTEDGHSVWKVKAQGRDNHTWDASYYGLWAAHMVGVGRLKAPTQEPIPVAKEPARPVAAPTQKRKIRTRYD